MNLLFWHFVFVTSFFFIKIKGRCCGDHSLDSFDLFDSFPWEQGPWCLQDNCLKAWEVLNEELSLIASTPDSHQNWATRHRIRGISLFGGRRTSDQHRTVLHDDHSQIIDNSLWCFFPLNGTMTFCCCFAGGSSPLTVDVFFGAFQGYVHSVRSY